MQKIRDVLREGLVSCKAGAGNHMQPEVVQMEKPHAGSLLMCPKRKPLAVGNVYRFPGYPNNGFCVTAMSLPGTLTDDGGIPGVVVQWLNPGKQKMWYPVASEKDFWQHLLFANACDPEYTERIKK